MHALGNHDNAALDVLAESYLRGRFPVDIRNLLYNGAFEDFFQPMLCKRSPRLVLDIVLCHPLMQIILLPEEVRFHLIDCRDDTVKSCNIRHALCAEIGNTDGSDLARVIQVLQRTVSTVIIRQALMDQHKVEIVSLELPKGFFPRSLCLFIAKLRYPNLCGEENILPAKERPPGMIKRNILWIPNGSPHRSHSVK